MSDLSDFKRREHEPLLARLRTVEAELDLEVRMHQERVGALRLEVGRREAAEARVEALETALREIARRGVKFDARGTHSAEVCDIARAALAVSGNQPQ